MMKKLVYSVAVAGIAAVIWTLPQPAFADKRDEKKAAKEGEQYFDGEIGSIDFKAGTVSVKDRAGAMTFTCDASTKYYVKQKKEGAKLDDFKVGDKVEVHYVVASGTPTCKRLAERGSHADKKERKAGN